MDPDKLLSRLEAASALSAAGYPMSKATLARFGSKGGGPGYRRFGRRVIYRWGDVLLWAENRGKGD